MLLFVYTMFVVVVVDVVIIVIVIVVETTNTLIQKGVSFFVFTHSTSFVFVEYCCLSTPLDASKEEQPKKKSILLFADTRKKAEIFLRALTHAHARIHMHSLAIRFQEKKSTSSAKTHIRNLILQGKQLARLPIIKLYKKRFTFNRVLVEFFFFVFCLLLLLLILTVIMNIISKVSQKLMWIFVVCLFICLLAWRLSDGLRLKLCIMTIDYHIIAYARRRYCFPIVTYVSHIYAHTCIPVKAKAKANALKQF